MKSNDPTLQIEITIATAERRKGARRQNAGTSKMPDAPRTPRITRLMALAIKFEDMVNSGEVRDYADLARLGYVSRARITQIMNLLNLAPDLQEALLDGFSAMGTGEHRIRAITRGLFWDEQRRAFGDDPESTKRHGLT